MVADAKDPNLSELDLAHVPRGPETFELAAKFCYGMNFEITTTNLARLHCVAEYLEMTEDYREEILIVRTETFLVEFVSPKLEKSVEVLSSCEALLPTAEEVGIPNRCIDYIARNAYQEQLVTGLSRVFTGRRFSTKRVARNNNWNWFAIFPCACLLSIRVSSCTYYFFSGRSSGVRGRLDKEIRVRFGKPEV